MICAKIYVYPCIYIYIYMVSHAFDQIETAPKTYASNKKMWEQASCQTDCPDWKKRDFPVSYRKVEFELKWCDLEVFWAWRSSSHLSDLDAVFTQKQIQNWSG